ncbi:hypothetical protein Taro_008351 [Colocasia esculenta]|uniref:Uncharacterized protein n=1 Tax=Colocasia esculenta TaxID=4460 RepID=A0A843TTG9_COLES|nr:hypothetical protein [Colocasia esculenta]
MSDLKLPTYYQVIAIVILMAVLDGSVILGPYLIRLLTTRDSLGGTHEPVGHQEHDVHALHVCRSEHALKSRRTSSFSSWRVPERPRPGT